MILSVAWVGLFAQSVPNTATFSLFDVLNAVYGSHTSGNLASAFTDSNAAYFDATYGSKTMSPKTMLGFRNYHSGVIDPCTLTVGDYFRGGYFAYYFVFGDAGYVSGECHGIIVSMVDLSTGIQWYNGSYVTTGATGQSIGDGALNTALIISYQGAGSYAASLCDGYSYDGWDMWVLPSREDLTAVYSVITPAQPYYWCSSENSQITAFYTNDGYAFYAGDKSGTSMSVRAIRYF